MPYAYSGRLFRFNGQFHRDRSNNGATYLSALSLSSRASSCLGAGCPEPPAVDEDEFPLIPFHRRILTGSMEDNPI